MTTIPPSKSTWVGETDSCKSGNPKELFVGGIDDLRRLDGFIPNSPRGSHLHRALMKFDVSMVTDPQKLKSATLVMDIEKHTHGFQDTPGLVTIWPIKSQWEVAALTWKSAENLVKGDQEGWPVKLPEENPSVWKIEVTGLVREWLKSPSSNHGIMFMNADGKSEKEIRNFNFIMMRQPQLNVVLDNEM